MIEFLIISERFLYFRLTIVPILDYQKVRKQSKKMNFISSLILVPTASDFQRLINAISTNLTKITNNSMLTYSFSFSPVIDYL